MKFQYIYNYITTTTRMSSALQKIAEIRHDATIDYTYIQGKKIILIIGPTGSGKSVILNVLAGSNMICQRVRGKWNIQANPKIAQTGHQKSMTFLPNCWISPKGQTFFDCPGFNDNRGPVKDIAKSYFLKQLTSNAQSMQIMFVVDWNTLNSVRGGVFGEIIQQTKSFFGNIDLTTDCQFIITKVQSDLVASQVSEIIQDSLNLKIPCQNITLFGNPDRKTNKLPQIDFNKIICNCPSIVTKCKTPLSNQSKLFLKELSEQILAQIQTLTKQLINQIQMFYLNLLIDNLDESPQTIKSWYELINKSVKNIHNFQGGKISDLKNLLKGQINKIISLGRSKTEFQGSAVFEKILEFIQGGQFIQCLADFQILEATRLTNIFYLNVKEVQKLVKRKGEFAIKDIQTLKQFLKRQQIDLSKDIKQQVHKKIILQKNITTPYQGRVYCSGKKSYSGTAQYNGSQAYSRQVQFSSKIPYSGSVNYRGSVGYTGYVQTPNCSHDRGFLNIPCLNCSHHTRQVPYSGQESYSGSCTYSGLVNYYKKIKHEGVVKYNASIPYCGNVDYGFDVSYIGSSTCPCKDHHKCSCHILSNLLNQAIKIFEQIQYYEQIKSIQEGVLKIADHSSIRFSVQDLFLIQKQQLLRKNLSKQQILQKIHCKLARKKQFSNSVTGKYPYNSTKAYKQTVPFKKIVPFHQKIRHEAKQTYSGNAQYSGYVKYSGSVEVWSCFEDCWACNGNSRKKDKYYNGQKYYSGSVPYNGIASQTLTQAISGNVQCLGQIPCAGEVPITGQIDYSNTHKVTCDIGKIGQGHHDCSSCQIWHSFIQDFKILLDQKEKMLTSIKSAMLKTS